MKVEIRDITKEEAVPYAITRTSFWQNEKRLCSLMTRATPESSI